MITSDELRKRIGDLPRGAIRGHISQIAAAVCEILDALHKCIDEHRKAPEEPLKDAPKLEDDA